MAGDIKPKYVASTALTVTNLQSLASSTDFLSGWCSASFNNTSDLLADKLFSGAFKMNGTSLSAGQVNVYVIPSLNDTPTWPASASGTVGTEGALSFTDTEERDSACRFMEAIPVDATASAIVYLKPQCIAALFGGRLSTHYCLFVSQNTGAALNSSGNAIYSTGIQDQYT